jgi:uncharacterized protein (TIGR01244 family)
VTTLFGGCGNNEVVVSSTRKMAAHSSSPAASVLKRVDMGSVANVHVFNERIYLAGQFTPVDVPLLKERGIQLVISVREDGEVNWDEKAALAKQGIDFASVPFATPETLTDDVFDKVRRLLRDNGARTVMLHCGTANRVGAVWAAYRAIDDGVDADAAISEAEDIGLRSTALKEKARDYIRRNY